MSFTYNINIVTDIDAVRFVLADNDSTNVLFQDEELTYCLKVVNNRLAYTVPATQAQIYLAGAYALESNATRLAELATIEKIAIFSENTVVTYQSVMEQAKRLKILAGQWTLPGVSVPDNFYTLYEETLNPFTESATTVPPSSNLAVW